MYTDIKDNIRPRVFEKTGNEERMIYALCFLLILWRFFCGYTKRIAEKAL